MFPNIRKLLGKDADSLSTSEETAVQRLIVAHRRLEKDGGYKVNTKSEAGFSACATFLDGIDATARSKGAWFRALHTSTP